MTEAMTETLTDEALALHATDAAMTRGIASTLQPGQTVTVFADAEPATFRVSLTGLIKRDANIDVIVDESSAANLSFDFRSTIVNGRKIQLSNRGREAQGVTASLIS